MEGQWRPTCRNLIQALIGSGTDSNHGVDIKEGGVNPSSLTILVSELSDVLDAGQMDTARATHKCEVYLKMMLQKTVKDREVHLVPLKGVDAFTRLIPLVDELVDRLDMKNSTHVQICLKCEHSLLDTMMKAEKGAKDAAKAWGVSCEPARKKRKLEQWGGISHI